MLRGCLPIHQGCILVQFCCYGNHSEEALGKCGQWRGTTVPLEFGTASQGRSQGQKPVGGPPCAPRSQPAHREPEVSGRVQPPPRQGGSANGAGSGGGRPVSARPPATGPSRGPVRPPLSSAGALGTLSLLWMFIHQPPPRVYVPAAAVTSRMVFRRQMPVCSPKAALTLSARRRGKRNGQLLRGRDSCSPQTLAEHRVLPGRVRPPRSLRSSQGPWLTRLPPPPRDSRAARLSQGEGGGLGLPCHTENPESPPRPGGFCGAARQVQAGP